MSVPPPPPSTSGAEASKKRKSTAPAPEDQRQKKGKKTADRAIPISSEDALIARLEQLKIGDSLIGQSHRALDAIGDAMTESDKRFCRALDKPMLAEFSLHRTIQVRP